MKILIEATNIITGGGVSHLVEMLRHTDDNLLEKNNIEEIVIWGVDEILSKIQNNPKFTKLSIGKINDNFIKRYFLKATRIHNIVRKYNIDIIFNPGGGLTNAPVPFITMCRNMLVFEEEEVARFKNASKRIKFFILRIIQSKSFNNADGVIFISNYAKNFLLNECRLHLKNYGLIYHGISDRFKNVNREFRDISTYTSNSPIKILYVSNLENYKHHDKVIEAIINVKYRHNIPIKYSIIGSPNEAYQKVKDLILGHENYIEYLGQQKFDQIQHYYKTSDIFIFASTCENMPNILIEALASGLPTACSKKLPMPEFAKHAAVYFNSEIVQNIEEVLLTLLKDKNLREHLSKEAIKVTQKYSWSDCADETFKFIKNIYEKKKKF